jgi:zinc transporter, ZIP family
VTAASLLPAVVAVVGFLVLRTSPDAWQYSALTAAAGLCTVAAFEDVIHEAHETTSDTRYSTVALIAGFTLFVFTSALLGN